MTSLVGFSSPRALRRGFVALSMAAFLSYSPFTAAQKARPSVSKTQESASPKTNPRAGAEHFRARVDSILSDAHAKKADWGILVADRDTGDTIFEMNSDRFFTPASNAKLFTSAFA